MESDSRCQRSSVDKGFARLWRPGLIGRMLAPGRHCGNGCGGRCFGTLSTARTFRGRWGAIALVAALVAFLAPAAAQAGTATLTGGTLNYTAAAGQTNVVTAGFSPGSPNTYTVSDDA